MIEQFTKDVDTGLSQTPKRLPSKYFYDEIGDALFVEIMNLEEYYLTDAELEIFTKQSDLIVKHLGLSKNMEFDLIELGAGDGLKTMQLLQYLARNHFRFNYNPIDISQNALDQLEVSILTKLPNINIRKQQGDYFQVLASLKDIDRRKVILFLGSNIGNLTDEKAQELLRNLSNNLAVKDKLVLGVDLIKPESLVLPAYNDAKGVTKAFNLNLLTRINRELEGDFDIENFSHQPEYEEDTGITKSFLVSKIDQTVEINKIGKSYDFFKGEKILMEISRKYNDDIIRKVLQNTRFVMVEKLMDSRQYFANYILEIR